MEASQVSRRTLAETLFVVLVRLAIQRRLIRARDLISDTAPILAWPRADPDAAWGHAPAHHLDGAL